MTHPTLLVGELPKRLITSLALASALSALGFFGSAHVSVARASSSTEAASMQRAKLLAEQTQPQREVPFNPADFDKFVGYYKSVDLTGFYDRVYRTGNHYYSQSTGQPPVEFFPESPTEFFATVVAAQISFVTSPDSRVTEMIIHQNGFLMSWVRISESEYEAAAAMLQQRIKENRPSPGTEAAVQRQIDELERTGHELYAEMAAPLAALAREESTTFDAQFKRMGPLISLHFGRVLPNGDDDYLATFAHGQVEVIVGPLTPDGKIAGLLYRLP